jgi:hypothetical protein
MRPTKRIYGGRLDAVDEAARREELIQGFQTAEWTVCLDRRRTARTTALPLVFHGDVCHEEEEEDHGGLSQELRGLIPSLPMSSGWLLLK